MIRKEIHLLCQIWLLFGCFALNTAVQDEDTCGCALENRPRDCGDIKDQGNTTTGIYTIYPNGISPIQVRCDMETSSGGWTVIQRRVSATEKFTRTWAHYQYGFGDLGANFWLGNDKIHELTKKGSYKLRIDMTGDEDESRWAEYQYFSVGNRQEKYKLYLEDYLGTAGDSLSVHKGRMFSTMDNDNDVYSGNCASSYLGGWWYSSCHSSNLNGNYSDLTYGRGLNWGTFTGFTKSLAEVSMKIKRYPYEKKECQN